MTIYLKFTNDDRVGNRDLNSLFCKTMFELIILIMIKKDLTTGKNAIDIVLRLVRSTNINLRSND